MLWLWIVLIVLFSIYFLGAIVFSCLNAKATVKPKILTIDREVDINRRKGLWGDFDSYTKVNYTIEGKDGYVLHTTFVDNEEVRGTGKYMIILHGRTSTRYGAVKYLTSYIKLGYSCVIYDARYHGVNVRDVCTLGNYESEDLMKVIEDTRNRYHDIKVLGLHGESMGSSAALIATKFNPEIDFIVADCPFTDVFSVIYRNYKRIHLHYLTSCIRLAAKLIYKVDINDTNALREVENNKYPILFIHGTGDTFIRPDHSEQLQKAASKNGAQGPDMSQDSRLTPVILRISLRTLASNRRKIPFGTRPRTISATLRSLCLTLRPVSSGLLIARSKQQALFAGSKQWQ